MSAFIGRNESCSQASRSFERDCSHLTSVGPFAFEKLLSQPPRPKIGPRKRYQNENVKEVWGTYGIDSRKYASQKKENIQKVTEGNMNFRKSIRNWTKESKLWVFSRRKRKVFPEIVKSSRMFCSKQNRSFSQFFVLYKWYWLTNDTLSILQGF